MDELYVKTNGGVLKIFTPPIQIQFMPTLTGEPVGKFIEDNGKMSFIGNLDESGKMFVDFVCETFNERIKSLIEAKKNE